MRIRTRLAAAMVGAAVTAGGGAAWAAEPGAAAASSNDAVVILDHNSLWRNFRVSGSTAVRTADGKLVPMDVSWYWGGLSAKPAQTTTHSPLPPADWAGPEFDDGHWPRVRLPYGLQVISGANPRSFATMAYSPCLVVLRGRFEVKDVSLVQSCRLSLGYFGGAVVYVNGNEVARGHVSGDKPGLDALAEDYPLEAFTTPEGKLLMSGDAKNADRLALRERKLSDVNIPAGLLRKGVNVLAVEVHAAPVNNVVFPGGGPYGIGYTGAGWPPVGPVNLKLTISPASAATPHVLRPAGLQIWNCASYDTVTAFDCGDPAEPLRPVSIVAARNGVFSGRFVVGSDQPIKGLGVTASDLVRAKGGGKIPATAVRVRYAQQAVPGKTWISGDRFDSLLDVLPAEIGVFKSVAPAEKFYLQSVDRKEVTGGALAPVWLTVRVPKDAAPGAYEGTLRVAAEGLPPVEIPVRVGVSEWIVPDPKNFRVANFAYHASDAVAQHYGVPLWSDRHFELMGQSLALLAEINSRQAIVNLAVSFYGGNKGDFSNSNAESMIRWIRQPDGSFKYDCTILDRYLDLVARIMDKPALVRVNCWGESRKAEGKLSGGEFPVTVFDPATGKLDTLAQPTPGTEEGYTFWKPVLDVVRKKMEARGWWDVTALGWNSYCYPPIPEVVGMAKRIWPDGVWSYTAHNGTMGAAFGTTEKGVAMPVRYADCVWNSGQDRPRGYRALLKPRPSVFCFTYRGCFRDYSPLADMRRVAEDEVMSGHDGVSDFGADLFPVPREKGKGFYCLGNGRGTGGPDCSTRALLAPGPDGAVATERFEMLREGVELAEAILFIQRAIEEKKIAGDLEQRANRYLDERGEAFMRGWFGAWYMQLAQDERLLSLAGEVAAAMGNNK